MGKIVNNGENTGSKTKLIWKLMKIMKLPNHGLIINVVCSPTDWIPQCSNDINYHIQSAT